MLWLLRSHRHLSKVAQQSRSFSFTPNPRLLRSPARLSPRVARATRPSPEHVSQTAETKFFSEQVNPPSARNQILVSLTSLVMNSVLIWSRQFFTFGSLFVFGVAARETNNDTYYWTKRFSESSVVWAFRSPTNEEMMRARHMELGKVKLMFSTSMSSSPRILDIAIRSEKIAEFFIRMVRNYQKYRHLYLRSSSPSLLGCIGGEAYVLQYRSDQRSCLGGLANPSAAEIYDEEFYT